MRSKPIIAAAAFLFTASGAAPAANPTRIPETGAFLLGNAYRCGVADDRVVRAGKVIRELMVAAADDTSEQTAAKSRFAEIFRESAPGGQRPHTDPTVPYGGQPIRTARAVSRPKRTQVSACGCHYLDPLPTLAKVPVRTLTIAWISAARPPQ